MYLNPNRILQTMAGAFFAMALMAGAQTPAPLLTNAAIEPAATAAATTAAASAPASAPAASSAPAAASASASAPAAEVSPLSNEEIYKDLLAMKARIAQLEAEIKARGDAAAAANDAGALRSAESGSEPDSSSAAPAQAAAPAAPAAAPAPPTWSVGSMDISGYLDGYYSYNANNPSNDSDIGQYNQLYNFNDVTNQFALSAAKLTLNHDPDPIGAHIDFIYGRTDTQINGNYDDYYNEGAGKYLEQAFISYKPVKAKGFEADFGKFVTSAGAEVIEAKDDWNYSRSLLFAHAIPYDHFGLRTSMPVTKTETLGLQVVNGLNTNQKLNNGVMFGLTSAYVKPKYTWNANYYFGPQNYDTQKGYLNLFDTTLLLTPTAKFSAYINYDYGQNRDSTYTYFDETYGNHNLNHWQGAAVALREQFMPKDAIAARYEFYFDPQGFTIGNGDAANCDYESSYCRTQMQEFTLTYEHKWVEGLLARLEYRHDWTNVDYFTKGLFDGSVKAQSTMTAGFIAFFGPKR